MSEAEDLAKLTILLAEDMDISRRVTEAMLIRHGVGRVISVSDGLEALIACRNNPNIFDALLCDIDMPHLDGMSLTRRIRAGEDGIDPRIPVIILTSNVDLSLRRVAELHKVMAFLEKPAASETLVPLLLQVARGNTPQWDTPSAQQSG